MDVFHAVNLCINKGFTKMWMEVDALLLINLLTFDIYENVDTFYLHKETKQLLGQIKFSISHILREDNKCVDYSANLGYFLLFITI